MSAGAAAATVSVDRFWCSRDGVYALDDTGFLRDPEATWIDRSSANPGVVRTEDLAEHRCLVLLGEPGAGKSTTIRAESHLAAADVPMAFFDLAAYGSEDRLVREVLDGPDIVTWSAGSEQLCLVLDSLDEARARIPHISTVIADRLRRLPYDRLHVRIACRTADWPPGLEQSLDTLFGSANVVEILPLRRSDAALIAADWCDPDAFLGDVEQAGAGPLAARPLTLRMLARDYGASGTLPQRGTALYAAGVRALCDEQNPTRLDAGLGGVLTLAERLGVARHLAAATVLTGAPAIWIGPESGADRTELTVAQLAEGSAPSEARPGPITERAIREALRTGLFTGRGEHSLGWAHATFADFLAAEWVTSSGLTEAQARSLFLGPDGRCWPQTRLTATWTVAVAPDRYAFLAHTDPEAFQGEVELPGDVLRAAVIDGLFSQAKVLTTARWDRRLRALRHR